MPVLSFQTFSATLHFALQGPFWSHVNGMVSHWPLSYTVLSSSHVDVVSVPMQMAVLSLIVLARRGPSRGTPSLPSLFRSYSSLTH